MTLTLEFGRDVPADRRDLLLTVNASGLAAVMTSLDEHLRSRLKYGTLPQETYDELQAVRDLLHTELGDLEGAVFG
jgi:hypothetical protein